MLQVDCMMEQAGKVHVAKESMPHGIAMPFILQHGMRLTAPSACSLPAL